MLTAVYGVNRLLSVVLDFKFKKSLADFDFDIVFSHLLFCIGGY